MQSSYEEVSAIIEAASFALQVLYIIEFAESSKSLNSIINPYNILPLVEDVSVEEWKRHIFRDLELKRVSWKQYGIKRFPVSLQEAYGSDAIKFSFRKKSCDQLDCFGYRNQQGDECLLDGPKNVPITLNENRVVACRPCCFLSLRERDILASSLSRYERSRFFSQVNKPTHQHVFFDKTRNLCRFGISTFRTYCLIPSKRNETQTNGNENGNNQNIDGDTYSFLWDEQSQQCNITSEYCSSIKGESFDEKTGDCYLRNGQYWLEFFFGKSIVRHLKNETMNTLALITGRNYYERSNASKSKDARIMNKLHENKPNNKLKTPVSTYTSFPSESLKPKATLLIRPIEFNEISAELQNPNAGILKSPRRYEKYAAFGQTVQPFEDTSSNYSQHESAISNKYKEIMKITGGLLGTIAVEYFGPKALRELAKLSIRGTESVFTSQLAVDAVETGLFKASTFLVAKTAAVIGARAVASSLLTVAEALNPIFWAVDLLSIAGLILDAFDTEYDNVMSKETMQHIRDQFTELWNIKHQYMTADNKQVVVELKPEFVHLKMFGSMLDENSNRYSVLRLKTFMYHVGEYYRAINHDKIMFRNKVDLSSKLSYNMAQSSSDNGINHNNKKISYFQHDHLQSKANKTLYKPTTVTRLLTKFAETFHWQTFKIDDNNVKLSVNFPISLILSFCSSAFIYFIIYTSSNILKTFTNSIICLCALIMIAFTFITLCYKCKSLLFNLSMKDRIECKEFKYLRGNRGVN